MARIRITAGAVSREAELNSSVTSEQVLKALPIEGRANRWGAEIYFSIPVNCEQEADAREAMQVGELAYWPPGKAFCIFFGPTPASDGDQPMAASAVNVIGGIIGDARGFGAVKSGEKVVIEKIAG
jgi:uncharacterized protein